MSTEPSVDVSPIFSSSRSLYAVACPSLCLWSVCLSVCNVCAPYSAKFSASFLRRLVPWSSADIHGKSYGDRPRGTPPSGGGVKTRGVAEYSDFGSSKAISRKRCNIGGKLVVLTSIGI